MKSIDDIIASILTDEAVLNLINKKKLASIIEKAIEGRVYDYIDRYELSEEAMEHLDKWVYNMVKERFPLKGGNKK